MPTHRELAAQRHLAKALQAAGADFTATAVRRMNGYTVTFAKARRVIVRFAIDPAVLENDPSPALSALVAEVRREMDRV
jgi:hypothetical protein